MEDQDRGRPRPRETEVPGLSPVRAFFVVCAIATVVGGGLFATRDASPSEPPAQAPVESPDFSLTDAEAIAEFERLNRARVVAYKSRDVSLLIKVLDPSSPLLARGQSEIRQLLRQGVLIRSKLRTTQVEVVSNAPTDVVVRQTEVEYPKIMSEAGRNVTDDRTPRKRVVEWTLRRGGTEWFIFDSALISEEPAQ